MTDTPSPAKGTLYFRIITSLGDITVETYADKAPHSVAAFKAEVTARRYSEAAFTRIVRLDNDQGSPAIEVVQAVQRATVVPDSGLAHEPTSQTGILHEEGTLSLPRIDGGRGSAQSFFICIGDQPALDAGGGRTADGLGFAAFGRVVGGMEVVRAIHSSATDAEAGEGLLRGQLAVEAVKIELILDQHRDDQSELGRSVTEVARSG